MSIRTERVARLIQREVADLLNTEFAGQLQLMMTVTGARVTKDLSIAYVYVSILGETEAQRQAAFRHLQELTPQIRAALATRIRHQVRQIPELRFFLDDTLEKARRIEDLFERIRAERERRSPESEEG
ncbi:30S ribosome-binding factor RbfA [Rhodocaloribacter litoris]|uniref:30S ribosome-binding factor RbfA n=1 Tax=Rhodocaloribacter litoris TaxID=2558931 RepID=UPI0014223ABD|nr:30S ribosome-binding factor RbfA [Rhodocaloribacter litoris]QXD14791.1 30S ribosome-binding factor RbfA [Rhodocaloribacter litoris]GIV59122.1 MAG: ribosome-binding factor A [Rhodothermaceae bacterium]